MVRCFKGLVSYSGPGNPFWDGGDRDVYLAIKRLTMTDSYVLDQLRSPVKEPWRI